MGKYNLIINLKGGSLDEQGVVHQMINNNIKSLLSKKVGIKWLEININKKVDVYLQKSIDKG